MHQFIKYSPVIFILMLVFCQHRINLKKQLTAFFPKKNVTILVTDSGLGGLSVAADVAKRLPQSGIFEHARIVFFNALFHNRSGYNSLTDENEKIRIFNIALEAMAEKYHPDLLLIACNTLSVFYDKTPFSQKASFPVIGIVETGVDLIQEKLEQHPAASVMIFATKTTIESNSHKNRLIERGYAAERIIGQACHLLAGRIEKDYQSEETIDLIRQCVVQAIDQLPKLDSPIFASLNCTHYGYSIQQFKNVFAEFGYPEIEIIDPNPMMAEFLFQSPYIRRYPETKVTSEVVSRVRISKDKITSLGNLLELTSAQTAAALREYEFNPELFNPEFDTTKIEPTQP